MKTSKKIKQLLKGKQYTEWHLMPGDTIEMTNDMSSPATVYVEEREYGFLGNMFGGIIEKFK